MLASGALIATLASAASGQSLPLKQAPDASRSGPCAAAGLRPAPPSAIARDRARRLTTDARRAAALGDQRTARTSLAEAARLDATSAEIAYALARTHEALGSGGEARAEYCRYLALAPSGADVEDVRDRLDRLVPQAPAPPPDALASFRDGVAAHGRRDLAAAETAFGRAIALAPSWGAPWYDRGVVRLARGREREALGDLVRYVELEPAAPDRAAVVARIASLRRRALDPSRALAAGMLLPGMGQIYTRRPVLGILALGATAGAAYWGLRRESHDEQRTGTFTDPFGVERSYTYTATVSERPNLAVGAGAAAGVWLVSALEAWRNARGASQASERPAARMRGAAPLVVPVKGGVGVGVALAVGGR